MGPQDPSGPGRPATSVDLDLDGMVLGVRGGSVSLRVEETRRSYTVEGVVRLSGNSLEMTGPPSG